MNDQEIQRDLFKKELNVSCETMKKFDLFLALLLESQQKFNLIGKGTLNKVWVRHFLDSGGLIKVLKSEIKKKSYGKKTITALDIGSGAGFPGIVLSILLKNEFKIEISLVESNSKKFFFLEKIKKALDLKIEIINSRAEDLKNKKFDFIFARAVAPLNKLFQISKKLINKNIVFIFFKGKTWSSEIEIIKKKWNFNYFVVKNKQDISNSGGVIIVFKQIRKIL